MPPQIVPKDDGTQKPLTDEHIQVLMQIKAERMKAAQNAHMVEAEKPASDDGTEGSQSGSSRTEVITDPVKIKAIIENELQERETQCTTCLLKSLDTFKGDSIDISAFPAALAPYTDEPQDEDSLYIDDTPLAKWQLIKLSKYMEYEFWKDSSPRRLLWLVKWSGLADIVSITTWMFQAIMYQIGIKNAIHKTFSELEAVSDFWHHPSNTKGALQGVTSLDDRLPIEQAMALSARHRQKSQLLPKHLIESLSQALPSSAALAFSPIMHFSLGHHHSFYWETLAPLYGARVWDPMAPPKSDAENLDGTTVRTKIFWFWGLCWREEAWRKLMIEVVQGFPVSVQEINVQEEVHQRPAVEGKGIWQVEKWFESEHTLAESKGEHDGDSEQKRDGDPDQKMDGGSNQAQDGSSGQKEDGGSDQM